MPSEAEIECAIAAIKAANARADSEMPSEAEIEAAAWQICCIAEEIEAEESALLAKRLMADVDRMEREREAAKLNDMKAMENGK